jgi:lysophospholipase L1-like esterase
MGKKDKGLKMRLLFIGDSLIEFFDWQARFPGHEVHNLGLAGETVEGLQARLGTILAGTAPPDAVFIMTGINNLAMDDRGFLGAYRQILARLRQQYPSARIYINSLLPALLPFISNYDVRAVNGQLRALAADSQAGYLDIHPLFLDEGGAPRAELLLDDGVHLSDRGYAVWSEAIAKTISEQTTRRS